ncbi:2-hydroxyacid dehydrogenase [Mordavella massiliensis]|uniref:2-hydroxyacid dehydrogenase n=1 Tax=Mordavella massiliensis TaxID=1871024 RepID=A0A938XC33_9CLOT|nr:2-hydroxyacid dehydrogenase [Mordavella massiliensis]MBM6948781.1 2-hydroxyacid dehydrogenase [Mordavella massiliensis]
MKTLITARFDRNYTDLLETITTDYEFAGYGVTGEKMPVPRMKEKIKGVELLISEFEDINREVIEAADCLKIIVCCRNEAFASVDIEAATEKGIPVLRAGGRNAIAVAEHTIALLMCVSKNISLTDHLLKYTDQLTNVQYNDNGGKRAETMSEWSMDPTAPFALYGGGPEMYGKTFGQIGFGMIGREVAKRARGLDMELLVYDPYVSQEQMDYLGAKKTDLDALMKTADFISINCNVVPETVGLISREKIALMKPTAYLVNTARAKILDYDALYDALAEKRIAGAGLDVYPVEPIPAGDKILSLRNIVLTPHLAGSARDIVGHQTDIVLTDVKKILAGEQPRFICNPEVLAQK